MKKIVAAFVFAIASLGLSCSSPYGDGSPNEFDMFMFRISYIDKDANSLLTEIPELRCQFDAHRCGSDKLNGMDLNYSEYTDCISLYVYVNDEECINDNIDNIEAVIAIDLPEEFGKPQRDTIRVHCQRRDAAFHLPERYVLTEVKYNDQLMDLSDGLMSATIDVVKSVE